MMQCVMMNSVGSLEPGGKKFSLLVCPVKTQLHSVRNKIMAEVQQTKSF